jgi:RHS repeat-associated protein
LTLNGTLTVVGGGAFVTRCLFNAPSSVLDGTGTVAFENGGGTVGTNSVQNSLSVGSGITIRTNSSNGRFSLNGNSQLNASVVVDGSTLTFEGTRFTSRGSITINNAGNLQTIASRWTNLGTVTMNGGTWTLGGTFRQSDMGRYVRNAGTITISAGVLEGNLNLTPATGSMVSNNARLLNGRYTSTGGAVVTGGLTLDNYILGSNFTPTGSISVANDLTLEGTTFRLNGIDARFSSTNSTVKGHGTIEFSNGSISMFAPSSLNLTIESGITLRTVSGNMTIGGNSGSQRLAFRGPVIVSAAGQTFNLSVPNAAFYNEVSIASGANLSLPGGNSGSFNFLPGSSLVTGSRTQISTPKSINVQTQNPGRKHAPGIVAMNGGTSSTPLLYEVAGRDLGTSLAGYRDNFAVGVFRTNTSSSFVRLVDNHDNTLGIGAEALYADAIDLPGMTLDLNGFKVYTRSLEAGTVLNGTITVLPDGGPIEFAYPTSGRISAAGQVDNWTFYGRAGQTVSAIINTGTNPSASAPGPVNPILNFGRLTLLSPSGATLGTASTTNANVPATISNITLANDGIYTLRMQANPTAPNSTGHYKLALYNVGFDEQPLVLNRPTVGAIETPFSGDRWTFSLSAGQQVQFDLLSADVNGLQFTLEGPNGYVAFSNLTNDSTLITIPPGNGGNYVLSVKGSSDQTGRYRFLVRDTSVTPLTLGVPFTGDLPGSGSPRWFKTTLPSTGQLLVTLDDANNNNQNQVYVRRGDLPTRETYDFRYATYDADQQIFIPNANAGDWFILVYGDYVPAPSTYSLEAEFSDLRITANTPDRYGVDNIVTLTIAGGGFEPGTAVKLVGGTTTINASTVEVDASTQITATFNLTGAPPRTWDLVVERAALSFTRPNAFITLPNLPAKLETKLVMPAFPTRVSASVGRVEYANTGNVAMSAPLLIVQSNDPEGDQFPILTLDMTRTVQDFWSTVLPPGTSHRLMMLGSGAVPGMLNPGERMSIPYNYLGEKAPFEPTDNNLELELLCVHDEAREGVREAQIDWAGLKSALKPSSVPADIWDAAYADVTGPLTTLAAYADMLVLQAAYLGRAGVRVVDVDDIWNFRLQQALGNISSVKVLSESIDMQVPTPGVPVTLDRTFANGWIDRNADGPFGFGWAVPWTATLSRGPNNDVLTINSAGGGTRVFVRDGRGSTSLSPSGNYFSSAGDASKMRRVTTNVYELREIDGTVTRFRPDGRIDYTQDRNGNRITSGYDASGRLTSLTSNSGGTITLAYNAAGRVESASSSTGQTLAYAYDPGNQFLLSLTADDGTSIGYTYDTSSDLYTRRALLSETSGGTTRVYTYDSQGRLATTSMGGAGATSFAYNLGAVTVTDTLGPSSIAFDHKLRLVRSTDRAGRVIRYTYGSAGQLQSVIYPDGATQRYDWCACGALLGTTDPAGRTVRFDRHPVNRLITGVTDPAGNRTGMLYDAIGNPLAIAPPLGSGENASNYTASGLPQAITNRNGQTATYTYNAFGRVTQRVGADGGTTNYTYDTRARLTSIAVVGVGTTTLSYDTAVDGDRVKRVTYPGGRFVEYDYDNDGRLLAMRDQSGFTTRYEYTPAGRLWRIRDTAGALVTEYGYDAAGRKSRVDNANGTFTTYAYRPEGDLLSVQNWKSPGVLNSSFTYAYDARSRIIGVTSLVGTWAYTYDPAGQITAATFASADPGVSNQQLLYTYDAAGNRVFSTANGELRDYNRDALNRYTQVDGVTYEYDLAGNLLFDGTRRFTYDDRDRLIRVEAGGDVHEFEYNAFGARSATIVNGARTNYLTAPGAFGEVLAEYDAAGNLLARNLYGIGLVGRSVGASGPLHFFDFDHQNSVAGLSDPSGSYVNRYAYDTFGRSILHVEGIDNPYEFVGGAGVRGGEVPGMLTMGARQYHLDDGRFTGVDPGGLTSDYNLYRYASNSPVMLIDPEGLRGRPYQVPHRNYNPLAPKPKPSTPDDSSKLGEFIWDKANSELQDRLKGEKSGWPGIDDAIGLVIDYYNPIPDIPEPGDIFNKILPGTGYGVELLLDPEVNQHFPAAMCGLALQREFGTINIGAAKQLAALEGTGGGSVNAACLDGFPSSEDADLGIGDACGSGVVSLAPRPLDPNEKKPQQGFGPENRIAIDDTIEYTVDYENLGPGSVDENGDPYPVVAAVAAQRVAIDDQLSPHLDWSTVRFTEFAFGDTIIPVADGDGSASIIVPAEAAGVAYVVEINAFVDLASGVLSVIFQAVDPLTGLPPVGSLGVVPPEDGSGNGMGHFKFSVRPLGTVPDGTAIRNVAIIQFDANDVIPTNQVNPLDPTQGTDPAREALVTIDAAAPAVAGATGFVVDAASPAVTVPFSEAVVGVLPSNLLVQNLTTPGTATVTGVSFAGNVVSFTLPGLLPDGNYAVTLLPDGITDGVGFPLAGGAAGEFFFLAGDANRDRSVDIADFSVLAARFNQPGVFSEGDFNYSGTVEIGDFALLAGKFNTTLPPVPRGVAPEAFVPATARRSTAVPAAFAGRPFATRPFERIASDWVADPRQPLFA